ncbi:MAG: hypothetical protein A2087_05920 [Spirochaetes bacterium GWD1_61_31]|nr:MAG: hypothetical protein A2Y37_07355 [Spirochaetes bacterium GWB1_60_80]OHD43870.1 MAG: hypothetical protein A2087_05920 [Spirochaetes bacterium GWD1_61_31]
MPMPASRITEARAGGRQRGGRRCLAGLACLVGLAFIPTQAASGQSTAAAPENSATAPIVRIEPAVPLLGADFSVIITLPGLGVDQLQFDEPLCGPLFKYLGSKIQPYANNGERGVLMEHLFRSVLESAEVEQLFDTVNLSIAVDGQRRDLGNWRIAVKVPPAVQKPRPLAAFWLLPPVLSRYQTVVGRLSLTNGQPVSLPALPTVAGVVMELLPGRQEFMLCASADFTLPALTIDTANGTVQVAAKAFGLQALPPEALSAVAIGDYRLSSRFEADRPRPGDSLSVQLELDGQGSPLFLDWPRLAIWHRDPVSGWQELPAPDVSRHEAFLAGRSSWRGTQTSRYTVRPERTGRYRLVVAPLTIYNPRLGQVLVLNAGPYEFTVVAAGEPVWQASDRQRQAVSELLAAQARRLPAWQAAADRLAVGDVGAAFGALPAAVRQLANLAAQAPWPTGTLPTVSASERLALALLLLLHDRKQPALNLLLQLEKSDWPSPAARRWADTASAALGQKRRFKPSLPAPGLCLLLAGLGVIGVLVGGLVRLTDGLRVARQAKTALPESLVGPSTRRPVDDRRRRWRGGLLAAAGLGLVWLIMAGLAARERRPELFAANGELVYSIPDRVGRLLFAAAPGLSGRVVRRAAGWCLVEYADGSGGWLASGELDGNQ